MPKYIPRLYVPDDLNPDALVNLDHKPTHYLRNVLRCAVGDTVVLFNGRDGEWQGTIQELGKKVATIHLVTQTRPQTGEPENEQASEPDSEKNSEQDVWLLFAPIKQARLEIMVEKVTELGVGRLYPVITDHTAVKRINRDRLQAHAVEAAEQCGRLTVPEVEATQSLSHLLDFWPESRVLLYGDERGQGENILKVLQSLGTSQSVFPPLAILIGPEGGFSESEFNQLNQASFCKAFSLGPTTLRSETAAIAALSCWRVVGV